MDPIKVCCFCERWESGGIESFLSSVLLNMDTSGIQVDIIASCLGESVFTAGLKQKGINFYELSGRQRAIFQNYNLFRRLVRERGYDVVHLNIYQGLALYYARVARQEGVPLRIAHSHGAGLRNSATKQLKLLLHRIGSCLWTGEATDLWACSGRAADFLFSDEITSQRPAQVIANGIETRRFGFCPQKRERIRSELRLKDKLVVGYVGRISQEKNQRFLLEVFAKLYAKQPQSCLLLAGDGELRQKLQKYAKRLEIGEAVIFLGACPNVDELMCAMDVFIFPGLTEGLGIAAVEAQASGLPVLCADRIPGETRLTGRLKTLPPEAGADAWAAEALRMAAGSDKRSSGAAEVKAAGFDIEHISREIEIKYRSARKNGEK